MSNLSEPARSTSPVAAIVFNPTKVSESALRELVSAAEARNGWAPSRWFPTDAADSGAAAARLAVSTTPDVVAVAGGDGTVRAVAEVIHQSGIPLALLPSGTGNLLARNLGVPIADLERAVSTVFTGVERLVDIAFATARHAGGAETRRAFVVMAGIGLDANMAENTDPGLKKRFGWGAYIDPIARSVIGNKQIELRYRVDGSRPRSLGAHTVIVGNCGTLTANILLLPDAVVDDGMLDVVVFRPRAAFGWARIGARLASHSVLNRSKPGRWVIRRTPDLKTLNHVQARRFDAVFSEPQLLQLDGDSIGLVEAVSVTLRHQDLAVRVPA